MPRERFISRGTPVLRTIAGVRRGVAPAVLAMTLMGCVQYVPADLAVIPPDEEVRVHLTDETAIRLAQRFGRIQDQLTASVAPVQPDSVSVTVWIGKDYPGTSFQDVRETVVLARDNVTALERRRIAPWRTALFSAGVVAGFALLVDRIFLIDDPNRRGGEEPEPPPPAILTIIRIPIG